MDELINDITVRLSGFGYEVQTEDNGLIAYLISLIKNQITSFTNLETVPEGLHYVWVDAVCSEFLRIQLSTGKIENVSSIVKSIQEGDTNVTFDSSVTPERQLLTYLDSLSLDTKKSSMVCYRVLTW